MNRMPRELELKLNLTGEELRRLQAHPALRELAIGETATRELRSHYFDTLDHRLREQGLSLRVRRVDDGWLQTVKFETDVHSGVSHPVEIEAMVDGSTADISAIQDKAIRKRVRKAVGKSTLVPLFETVVQRTSRKLNGPEGAEIEVAFDEGVVRADEGSSELCEAELELKSGTPGALSSVAETLFADEVVRLSEVNKAEQGYRLVSHQSVVKLQPVKASAPHLDATHSCAEAFSEMCRSATDQILHNWSVVLDSDDPEGTHQVRIGLRRLRSAFKIFRPVVDNEALRELDRKARDLARLLGEVRDSDVLATDIVGLAVAARSDDPEFESLKAVLARNQADCREKVRDQLRERQWSFFKVRLAMLPESISALANDKDGETLTKPIGKLTDKALKKGWRRVAKSGRRLSKLTTAERHEMRKDLKTLRYAVELLAPLYPTSDVRRFTKKLRRLQDMFGYLNDVVGAEKLNLVGTEGADPKLLRAVGYVIGWHTATAQNALRNANLEWRRLKRAPKFWL